MSRAVAGGRTVHVRVPASSANLGPGFDALAVALTMSDSVTMSVTESGLAVDVFGAGADVVPRDEQHLVVRAMRAAFDQLSGQPDGLRLVCHNAIPQGRGLGSSAAAVVAGILGARALVDRGSEQLDDSAVLRLAAELEGHPDNVAACLLGGLTVAWTDQLGAAAVRIDVQHQITVFAPLKSLSTRVARAALPQTVPHADAVRTAGRAALLVAALSTTQPPESTLLAATEDLLHQPYRADLMPVSLELLQRLRGSGLPAALSGAGPAVLVFGSVSAGDGDAAADWGVPGWAVHKLAIDAHGARVVGTSAGE